MRKVKISELSGANLDYAVAKALGIPLDSDGDRLDERHGGGMPKEFKPSTNWKDGGKLIESESISVFAHYDEWKKAVLWWKASCGNRFSYFESMGETPLIAAMRCFVHSKIGDEIEFRNG